MVKNELQINFLNRIIESLPDSISVVDELSDLLGISNDSAYRRLRGETSLSINEVATLCSHYNVSFDMFAQYEDSIAFKYNQLNDSDAFKNFLNSILNDMQQIAASKDPMIKYAAVDVPIFHHFNYPELSAFKMFYWMKAIVGVEQLKDKKFSVELINQEISDISKAIYDTYNKIPSVEIWTTETINSLIKQVQFYWESGNFQTQKDALIVCNQVKEEIEVIEKQAEYSAKSSQDSKSFMIYHSDIEIGNNCIYTKRAELKSVYLSVHTFNKLTTTNQKFIYETELWLNNLISKSTLISGVSQKNRYQFFKKAYQKIDDLILLIEKI
ncbi:MAG: hypothetical protein JXR60_00490 [Bacteroidales bacterium]|nr:hypothetical protein [Bacteroidales bacterium]